MDASLSSAERYEKICVLGEGTFGVVSKAKDKTKTSEDPNQIVAIKKVRMGHYKDGVSITALREIKLMQEIKHPNVIGLLDVFAGTNNVNMVLEYCVTDLEDVIRDRSIILTPAEVKCCMKQMMEGLKACHDRWTLHRDLKPSNVLIGADGELKLADFGLARIHGSPNPRLTHQVVTRWYRAPELLYGSQQYSTGVDIWSMGCIFAEIMLRMPYLPGDSDVDQLAKIFQARGTPTDENWPDRVHLPCYIPFSQCPEPDHKRLFTASTPASLRLLDYMLELDPLRRPTADQVLQHEYFVKEQPPACSSEDLLRKLQSSQTLKQKQQAAKSTSPVRGVEYGAMQEAHGAHHGAARAAVRSPISSEQLATLGKRKLDFA